MIIVNHECYVSLEVAELLKEAGFDWECRGIYVLDSENDPEYVFSTANFTNTSKEIEGYIRLSAPTLSVAQRWLREVKRIFITVSVYAVIEQGLEITDSDKFSVYAETWDSQSEFWNKWTSLFEIDDFNTYEEAQEAGIKKCLTLILK